MKRLQLEFDHVVTETPCFFHFPYETERHRLLCKIGIHEQDTMSFLSSLHRSSARFQCSAELKQRAIHIVWI